MNVELEGPGAQSVSTGRKLAQRASEKIDRALELKDEGNAAFRAEDYRSALKKYHHALMYTRGVTDQGSLDNFPGLEQMLKYVASEEDKRVANDLALVVRNNMSACLLKTEKWKKASEYASRVLQDQPDNAKALFRRGTARIHLNQMDEARHDLLNAQRLNPQNGDIKRQLAVLDKKTREIEMKEHKMYSTMLGQ